MMTWSFGALCLWAIAANVIALFPSRHHHWPAAYALTAVGVPLLVWVIYENRPLMIVLALGIWVSVLRWPLLYFGKWLRRTLAPRRRGR